MVVIECNNVAPRDHARNQLLRRLLMPIQTMVQVLTLIPRYFVST
jgi:hypothetical protein